MDHELLNKSKEELVSELKRTQMALYMRELDGEDYQAHINMEFNGRINRLFLWLRRYKQIYPRIALYGNSEVGRIVARELGGALVVVADQSAGTIRGAEYTLCVPEQLADYDFDCVIICVMGREKGVRAYLRDVVGIPAAKILAFDLAHELPLADCHAADARNLTGRIKRGEPIIGHHPLNVQIQTVSTCNANCYFCPYVGSWHQQNPGRMDDELYRKIIDQLARYRIKKFCPYLENEPLLDKHLFDRIQYAVDALQPEVVEIATNLSVLLERHVEGFANVLARMPHELRISFHGIDKTSYEDVMQLDYEQSLANVKRVVTMMQEIPLNVVIRGAGEPRRNTDQARQWFGAVEYHRYWQEQLNEFEIKPRLDFFTYHDRGGQVQLREKGVEFHAHRETLKDFYCTRFDRWAHFLYTGEPILCCMDYNRETVFTDTARKLSVDEIFSSEGFHHLIMQGTGMCESKPDHICKRCISPGG